MTGDSCFSCWCQRHCYCNSIKGKHWEPQTVAKIIIRFLFWLLTNAWFDFLWCELLEAGAAESTFWVLIKGIIIRWKSRPVEVPAQTPCSPWPNNSTSFSNLCPVMAKSFLFWSLAGLLLMPAGLSARRWIACQLSLWRYSLKYVRKMLLNKEKKSKVYKQFTELAWGVIC